MGTSSSSAHARCDVKRNRMSAFHVDSEFVGGAKDSASVVECPGCTKRFKPIYRPRYNCTQCGEVFCSKCLVDTVSSYTALYLAMVPTRMMRPHLPKQCTRITQ